MKLREKLESSKQNHNQHHTLLTDSTKLHHKIDTLENANIKLSTELAELSAECRRLRSNSDKRIDHSSLNSDSSSSNKKLLLGSSMIRDFNPNKQSNIEVKCIRGAQSDDLSDFLKKNECTYNQVILVVGSNDCSTKLSAEEVVLKMKNLACVAQRFSKQPVILSSICPRTDNPSFQMKAESVNAALSACDTSDFLFVNNDPSFRLQDDTINDGYLHKDGHHLSCSGSMRLARNLKLGNQSDIIKSSIFSSRQSNQTSYQGQSKNNNPWRPQNKKKQNYTGPARKWWSSQSKSHTQSKSHSTPNHGSVSPYKNAAFSDQDSRHCWYCGEEAHTTERCFHGKQITCRACGGLGHKDKMCWFR